MKKLKDFHNRILNRCVDCNDLIMRVHEDGSFSCETCGTTWKITVSNLNYKAQPAVAL